MTSVSSLRSLTLDLPPSCVGFWPARPEYFVIGTYFLENEDEADLTEASGTQETREQNGNRQKGQHRKGSLMLFRLDGDEVIQEQTLEVPFGVLDLHFYPSTEPHSRFIANASCLFGVATSTGSLALYGITQEADGAPQIIHATTLQFFPHDELVLSFTWHPANPFLAGLTLASGAVIICRLDALSNPRLINTDATNPNNTAELQRHSQQAWTMAFTPSGEGVLSGGDDAVLKYQGLPFERVPAAPEIPLAAWLDAAADLPAWTERKIHGAGVTAVLPLLDGAFALTGSYDDHVRMVHVPEVGAKRVLAERNLGGGVWRLRFVGALPSDMERIHRLVVLASCMFAGVRLLEVTQAMDDSWRIEVVASFEEHKSMNYASDVQPGLMVERRSYVSTSFYDRLLCLWRYQVE
ncbi:hypothetical protein H2201_004668 [Coniosporium apollinis]|uniref:methylated diphthine methylhydrolase n=1 Tax=Coniosporium apollinis TaxID=61459 RepID=A0ABQ9NVB0_9PEZI|nr:hypothetical protein H2201_004668 [Coniosporium apollinis]